MSLELKIIDLNNDGVGIAKKDGKVYFVPNTMPEDLVLATITQDKKRYSICALKSILEPSPKRNTPACEHYFSCGGCNMQHMDFSTEGEYKRKFLNGELSRQLDKYPEVGQIYQNVDSYYRNKVIFAYSYNNKKLEFGFYKNNTHTLVPLNECMVTSKSINIAVNSLTKAINKELNKTNNLVVPKYIMLRQTQDNQIMIVLVLPTFDEKYIPILKAEAAVNKNICSVFINVNPKDSKIQLSRNYTHVCGKKELLEDILGIKYLVSPQSFLQINNDVTEKIYSHATKDIKKSDVVLDMYCGIGSISLVAAKKAKKVIGVEVVDEAIKNAKASAALNNISNAEFFCAKSENIISSITAKEKIDVVILDPPRAGIKENVILDISKHKISKVIYVSCSPKTLARDLKIFSKSYEIKEIKPFNMFPRTNHVETVVLMSRVEK